jgi:tetratricopeptide (TPR) repeat protein
MPGTELFDRAPVAPTSHDPRQAEADCRRLIQGNATRFEPWLLLGQALQQQGKQPEAIDVLTQALKLAPSSAEAHLAVSRSLISLGQRIEAIDHLRRALALRPSDAEAEGALGVTLAETDQMEEAVAHLRQAVALRPDFAPAWQNLGVTLGRMGRHEEGLQALEEAVRVDPHYGEAWYNLGIVHKDLRHYERAETCYRNALEHRPGHAGALNNLGQLLTEVGRPEEGVVLLREAAWLDPALKEAPGNLALALAELGRFQEAEEAYHQALKLDPWDAKTHGNYGCMLKEQGRFAEALAAFQVALWLDPHSASLHYNRGLTLLQMGDWARGWQGYERRFETTSGPRPRPFKEPRWDGSDLGGKTILLWCEQGVGDIVQFVRYAALVKARGGRVVLECRPELKALLSGVEGVDEFVTEGEALPAFDVQASLLSLPGILGTTVETVPWSGPYLRAEPARVGRWRERLAGLAGLKVGMVWQGNPKHKWDRHRSFPLTCLAPLAAVDGVRLISLQKGPGAEQVRGVKRRFEVVELGEALDAEGGAFVDTAAVMQGLDLVVTADTAAGHLAGALGRPVWLALSAISDWRWLREREDTPWYPTMRLFRQRTLGEWDGVFAPMAEELRRLVEEKERKGLLRVAMSAGDVLDKLTILEIKAERLTDPAKVANVRAELAEVRAAWDRSMEENTEVERIKGRLKEVNETLWHVEDELRQCEEVRDFGPGFVELARSVYRNNDERAALKRRVNELMGAAWGEQKEYSGGGERPDQSK